jgi:hypothetical protein
VSQVGITGASDLPCWRQSYSSMPKPAAAICWKVAPLIQRDSAFCSFSRAWSCAGRELWSPPCFACSMELLASATPHVKPPVRGQVPYWDKRLTNFGLRVSQGALFAGPIAFLFLFLFVVIAIGGLIVDAQTQSQIDLLNARRRIALQLSPRSVDIVDSQVNTTYFDRLVAINVENLATYYELVKTHTNKSFIVSISAGGVGFTLIVIGLIFGFESRNGKMDMLPYLSAGSGVLTEFIAAVFFYLYNRTVRQMKDYHDSLLVVQNVLLAFKIVGDIKDESDRVKMVSAMLAYLVGKPDKSHVPHISAAAPISEG